MADVTDPAFRRLIAKYSRHGQEGGGPDVMWTEFVSADGLVSPGREVLLKDLAYTEGERPIVAQLFTSNPLKMREAAKLAASLGFDGIDINMGCPDRSIEKQGAGAAMIKTPERAREIIQAVKDGISDAGRDIPVSVKTRVGYNQVQIDEWIPNLLSCDIAALTVHVRTRKELSNVPAPWERIREVIRLRDKIAPQTKIIGNGDVTSLAHGRMLAKKYGVDGVMIGRAMFGNPWLFDSSRMLVQEAHFGGWFLGLLPKKWRRRILGDAKYTESDVPYQEKLRVLVEHCALFEELLGDVKNFAVMKKHFKAYTHGFPGAKELRMALMECMDTDGVLETVENFLAQKK